MLLDRKLPKTLRVVQKNGVNRGITQRNTWTKRYLRCIEDCSIKGYNNLGTKHKGPTGSLLNLRKLWVDPTCKSLGVNRRKRQRKKWNKHFLLRNLSQFPKRKGRIISRDEGVGVEETNTSEGGENDDYRNIRFIVGRIFLTDLLLFSLLL